MHNLLVFREGARYSREKIQSQLDQIRKPDMTDQCIKNIKDLQIPRAYLAVDTETDLDNESKYDQDDEELDELEDQVGKGYVFLTRTARNGDIIFRHLVGAAALPCGIHIEVLPKIGNCDEDDRQSFQRMWEFASDLSLREHNEDDALVAEYKFLPLHEWLARKFLCLVKSLIARGIRSHYVEREDNLSTVRGRLLVSHNLRTNLLAPHRFFCRFEEFSTDRPENRLVRSAVLRILRNSNNPENMRLAAQLNERLHEIPVSVNFSIDFSNWKNDRLMTSYRELREPCRWILQGLNPSPVRGEKSMYGRFVRMNDVFERYVTRWMDQKLIQQIKQETNIRIFAQGQQLKSIENKHLCEFSNGKFQNMRPDALVMEPKQVCVAVLDAKWKKIDDNENIWKPSREDLYQMYAYATHWLTKKPSEPDQEQEQAPRDRLIALIFPTTNRKINLNALSSGFTFISLLDVQGIAFKFLLPIADASVYGGWSEGLIIPNDILHNFPFLKNLQPNDHTI